MLNLLVTFSGYNRRKNRNRGRQMAANAKEEKKGGKRQTAKKRRQKENRQREKVSRGKKTTGGFRWWKLLFFAALAVGAALALYVGYCFATLPDIEQAVSRTRQPSTSIIAENGQEIATFGNVYSEVVYPDERRLTSSMR